MMWYKEYEVHTKKLLYSISFVLSYSCKQQT